MLLVEYVVGCILTFFLQREYYKCIRVLDTKSDKRKEWFHKDVKIHFLGDMRGNVFSNISWLK